jgi:hypothetical protein
MFSINLIIRRAIGGPRRFSWVGSREGIDAHIIGKVILEHGSGFTGFKIEGELFIHFIFEHSIEGFLELVGIEIFMRESNKIR